MQIIPTEFQNVTAVAKANIYFGGRVVSHTILSADGSKKTLGIIFPGLYFFDTAKAERMEIVAGTCSIKMKGATDVQHYKAGDHFDIPANSAFEIETIQISEYICSYLD